jgi:hypothetical protein
LFFQHLFLLLSKYIFDLMKKTITIAFLLTIVAVTTIGTTHSFAAAPPPVAPPPPPGGGGPPCWPPPCVPIDGGISLLLAAGLALGGRKLLKNSKKVGE